jgi:large subunit ribosomal protein L24
MTAKKFKIKRGDLVQVTAGKEKGKRGEVTSVVKTEDRVVVKGINMVTRFAKQSAQNPNGIFQKEASLHISNVALVNPETDAPAKVGYRLNDAGKKERYFKGNGAAV